MRYILGLLITIGLLILAIVLIVSTGSKAPEVKRTDTSLPSYSTTDATVRLIVDGPINYKDDHQQFQITVGRDNVNYTALTGYNGQAVRAKDYSNTQNSYYNFLRALNSVGFTRGNPDPRLANNTGYCPTGNRYSFQLIQDGKLLQNYWTTSCGGTQTYNGQTSKTINLFEAQIPDIGDFNEEIDIPGF